MGRASAQELLSTCPPEVAAGIERRTFPHGAHLVEMGQRGGRVYLLLEGAATVSTVGESGAAMVLSIYRAGDMVGEAEVVDDLPAMGQVAALGECRVAAMSRETFLRWLKADERFARFVVGGLSRKLYDFSDKAVTNITTPLRHRLALLVAEAPGGVLRLDKEIVAAQLGTSVRSLNRTIKELVQEGRLRYRAGVLSLAPGRE